MNNNPELKAFIEAQVKYCLEFIESLEKELQEAPKALLGDSYPKYLVMVGSLAGKWEVSKELIVEDFRLTGIKFATRTSKVNAQIIAKAVKNGHGDCGEMVYWKDAYRSEILNQKKLIVDFQNMENTF